MKNDATIATPTKKHVAIIILEIESKVMPYHKNIAPMVVNTTKNENNNSETVNLIKPTVGSSLYLILFLPSWIRKMSVKGTLGRAVP